MKTNKYILTLALTICCALGNLYAINSTYYSTIDGKSGKDLFDAVHAVAKTGYSSLSYAGLWTAYQTTDVYPTGHANAGKIWDMYGNCVFTYSTNQCGNYSGECDCYNREHSIPKSWFGGTESNNTPGSDLFHVVPTDGKVNGIRSNYAFGEVNAATYTYAGSKLGSKKSIIIENSILNASGSSTQTCSTTPVFEPVDEYKGDFARGYLGTMIRWANGDYQTFTTGDGASIFNTAYDAAHYYGLTAYGVALLLKWHRQDPVSQKEIDRNNGIQTKQGNRNPFIDYPCLVEYIWGNKAGETVNLSELTGTFSGTWTTGDGCPCGDVPAITLPTGDIFVGSTEANSSVTKTITVQGVNLTTNLSLAISGTNSSLFSLNATTIQKAVAMEGCSVTITYTPTAAGNHSAVLTISGGGLSSSRTFNLSGTCCNPYMVTLSRNGLIETIGACGTYTLPTAEDEEDACDGWEFQGWVTSGTAFEEGQTTAPTFVTEVSSATTLYAVYGKTEGGSATWTKVTNASTLKSGDVLVIASGANNVTAGAISSQVMGSVSSTFSSDKSTITSLGSGTVELTLGGSSGAWTLSSTSGALGATAVKKLAWGSGTQTWSISISSGNATITNGTSSYGTMKYNTQDPRFTTYASGQADVQLYRKEGGSTTTYKKSPCTTYTISYADAGGVATGGTYSANVATALAGTTITLDYDEEEGYEFTGWTVTYASTSATIAVTNGQFTMPEANVTVQANFNALCSQLSTPDVTATPGDGQITLTWEDVTGADHYTVSIGTGAGYTTECGGEASIGTITQPSSGTNQCIISGLTNGLAYTTYVVANGISSVCDSDADVDTTTPTANTHIVTFTPSPTGATVTVNDESTSPLSVNYNTTVTVVVTPDAHYTLTTFTVTGESGSVAVSGEGNTRTFTMPDEDVTVAVTMTEDTKYTVNWYVNGTSQKAEENYAGETLAGIGTPSIECNDKVFQGWTSYNDYDSDDAPDDLFTSVADMTMPVGGANYYAVFATVEESEPAPTNNYQKITSTSELTTGNYLIVGYYNGYKAMSTTWKDTYYLGYETVTPSDDVVTTTDGTIIWNITVSGELAAIYNEAKGYLYIEQSGSYYNIKLGDNTTDNKFTYSVNAGNWLFTSVTYSTRVLEFYKNKDRWAYHTAADAPVYLYKQQYSEGSTTISGYTTSCTPPADVTVTFNANDGNDKPATATQTILYNEETALDANTFSRTGYHFTGWNTAADGTGAAYADEAEVMLTKDLTLYAQWAKNSYNVSFTPTMTGATITVNGQSTSPQSVAFESEVTIAVTTDVAYAVDEVSVVDGEDEPVSVTNNGDGTYTFTMPASAVTVTVTLTAQPLYTIRFIDNGAVISTQEVFDGQLADKPSDPTPCDEKYTFEGWANATLAEDSETKPTLISDFTASQDQDYYAVYSYSEESSSAPVRRALSKATSISTGDKVVFVCENVVKEMTSISSTSTPYGIGSDYTGTPAGTFEFDVVTGNSSGTLAFKNGDNYLNWSSGNSLNVNGTLSNNTSWKVEIDGSGNATIKNANDENRVIWWNVSSPRFACYTDKTAGASYNNIQLYKNSSSGTTYYTTAPDCEPTPTDMMIVAEYGGARIALTHNNDYTTFGALPMMFVGGKYFYPNTEAAPVVPNMTWQVTEMDGEGYIIKAGEQYLAPNEGAITLSDKSYPWPIDEDGAISYDAVHQTFVVGGEGSLLPKIHVVPVLKADDIQTTSLYSDRTLTPKRFGTLCLPHAVALPFAWGVKVYSVAGAKRNDNDDLTGIYLEEEIEMLEAGKPYLIEPVDAEKSSTMQMWYAEGMDVVTEPIAAIAMVGNLSDTAMTVPYGSYVLSQNQLRKVAIDNQTIGQYKAYFDLNDLEDPAASPQAHAYRVMYVEGGEQVVTDLSQTPAAINWDEPVYNILGMRVDRNATGVLIQGGVKFIIRVP